MLTSPSTVTIAPVAELLLGGGRSCLNPVEDAAHARRRNLGAPGPTKQSKIKKTPASRAATTGHARLERRRAPLALDAERLPRDGPPRVAVLGTRALRQERVQRRQPVVAEAQRDGVEAVGGLAQRLLVQAGPCRFRRHQGMIFGHLVGLRVRVLLAEVAAPLPQGVFEFFGVDLARVVFI